MLSQPDDLATEDLVAALSRHWQLAVASIEYRAVGFGSHHWAVTGPAGGEWFVTADDLEVKRLSGDDPLDAAYTRLRQALDAARGLHASGAGFVVAPVPTVGGDPAVRLDDRYTVAVYPLLTGESFHFGTTDPVVRENMLRMVIDVHRAPADVARRALVDDLAVPHRDALDAALAGSAAPDLGPYVTPAADLIAAHAGPVRAVLAHFDLLAADADLDRAVLTHGEPHPGNTMRTPDGWRLIDWDTALVAPPERDLWHLGGDLSAYTSATGVEVRPELLEMFRLRWDIADIAVGVDRFRRPHPGDPNDDEEWDILRTTVGGISL